MALAVHSKFYYGITISPDSRFINFKEGAGAELTAELDAQGYSLEELAAEFERALNEAGALDYTATVDRDSRTITVTAGSNFSLLVSSGTNASESAWEVLGFTAGDITSVTTATSDTAVGKVYSPQFPLQSYSPKANNKRALNSVVSKSASGKKVSILTFGVEYFVKFNIQWVTNLAQGSGLIRNDPAAVENLNDFMSYLIGKDHIEFMEDESDSSNFLTLMLESTEANRDGIAYELQEYYDKQLPGWFETGLLTFKVIE